MLTIITVTYNNYFGVKKTYDSISQGLKSHNESLEWLIIDGGSEDSTHSFLASLNEENISCLSEKDDGIFDAMNKGVNNARFPWTIFLNAGDEMYMDISALFLRIEANCLEYDIICFDTIYGSVPKKQFRLVELRRGMIMACHQSIIFSISSIKQVGGYRTRRKIYGDFDLLSRQVKNGSRILQLSEVLTVHEMGGISSKSSWSNRLDRWSYIIENWGLKAIVFTFLESLGLYEYRRVEE